MITEISDRVGIDVWDNRWSGLQVYIDNVCNRLDVQVNISRKPTIKTTLECLKVFGGTQFEFFKKGFLTEPKIESKNFPAENALAATLDQISYDIALLERVAEQRKHFGETLDKADCLAYEALKPLLPEEVGEKCSNLVLREPTTVLTYFQKDITVRIIPYAPVVLIGIPYSTVTTNVDFLAIPHEIGHYIFRHSIVRISAFQEFVRTSGFDRLKHWFEEIFADIYGTLVAGHVIALSFQDILTAKTMEDFYRDDGDHPKPALRPYIYINVLERFHDSGLSQQTELIRQNWKAHLDRRKNKIIDLVNKDETKIGDWEFGDVEKLSNVREWISTSAKIDPTKYLDKMIMSVLDNFFPDVKNVFWPVDYGSLPKDGNVASIYKKFDIFVNQSLCEGQTVPELGLDEENRLLVNGNPIGRSMGVTGLERIDKPKRDFLIDGKGLDTPDWLYVLDAGGWTVRGPQCESSAGVCAG